MTSTTDRAFTIERAFDTPREFLFQVWTDPKHLMRWFGPKGFIMLAATLDLRPDGIFHYGMRSPDGAEMWGKWLFRDIVAPERLEFVVSFSDPTGGLTRHPFAPDWPLQTLSTVTFAEQDDQTALAVEWVPLNPTEAERATFDAGHDSMRQGWGGTLEQLTAYLHETRGGAA